MKTVRLVFLVVAVIFVEVIASDFNSTVTLTGEVAKQIFYHIENIAPGLSKYRNVRTNRFGDIRCSHDLGLANGGKYSCFFQISINNSTRSYDSQRKIERRQITGIIAQKSFLELFVKNFNIDPDLKKDVYGKCLKFSDCIKQYSIPEGNMNCRESKTSFGAGFTQIFYTCSIDEKFVDISEKHTNIYCRFLNPDHYYTLHRRND